MYSCMYIYIAVYIYIYIYIYTYIAVITILTGENIVPILHAGKRVLSLKRRNSLLKRDMPILFKIGIPSHKRREIGLLRNLQGIFDG